MSKKIHSAYAEALGEVFRPLDILFAPLRAVKSVVAKLAKRPTLSKE